MTKEELWSIYAQRNPSFNGTEPVTLTPAGLKKLFEQTWDHAYEAGADDAEGIEPKYGSSPASELYEKIFGRKKPF